VQVGLSSIVGFGHQGPLKQYGLCQWLSCIFTDVYKAEQKLICLECLKWYQRWETRSCCGY